MKRLHERFNGRRSNGSWQSFRHVVSEAQPTNMKKAIRYGPDPVQVQVPVPVPVLAPAPAPTTAPMVLASMAFPSISEVSCHLIDLLSGKVCLSQGLPLPPSLGRSLSDINPLPNHCNRVLNIANLDITLRRILVAAVLVLRILNLQCPGFPTLFHHGTAPTPLLLEA